MRTVLRSVRLHRTGESGPVAVLSGEADMTSAGRLSEFLAEQMPGDTRTLVLVRPQPPVARVLELTGAVALLAVRD